jgi:methionyl-tRNA synthetase
MIQNPKRYTITAALPYERTDSHWPAGVYVPSDIYSRYLRLQGRDVLFVCGSDEHGVAISESQRGKYEVIIISNHSLILEFQIIILELRLKFIMIRLRNFLKTV